MHRMAQQGMQRRPATSHDTLRAVEASVRSEMMITSCASMMASRRVNRASGEGATGCGGCFWCVVVYFGLFASCFVAVSAQNWRNDSGRNFTPNWSTARRIQRTVECE